MVWPVAWRTLACSWSPLQLTRWTRGYIAFGADSCCSHTSPVNNHLIAELQAPTVLQGHLDELCCVAFPARFLPIPFVWQLKVFIGFNLAGRQRSSYCSVAWAEMSCRLVFKLCFGYRGCGRDVWEAELWAAILHTQSCCTCCLLANVFHSATVAVFPAGTPNSHCEAAVMNMWVWMFQAVIYRNNSVFYGK